jgi:PKD repeat protein
LNTDSGENSFYTLYSDHYAGVLNGGQNITENTPAVICGHYGMWPHSNTNSFKYFNGNTAADGLNTGNNNAVYTATLDGTQTYYQHIAEAADCNGYWKPYRWWDNGNYTPPTGQQLNTDSGENSFYTLYSDHYAGDLFCGENTTENTPAVICGHYGMWPHSNTNSFKYFNGNTAADGLNTGNNNPVYTATFDCSKTGYSHVAEAADCDGYWKPYRYWNTNYISHPAVPVANFTGVPTTGPAPLIVNFTDTTTNTPTSWRWDFGDGNTSTLQNPSHTYEVVGMYDVSLKAVNAGGNYTKVETGYITVTSEEPVADFTGDPLSGTAPLIVAFTDSSTGSPTSWSWSFGDGQTSIEQNPSHTYAAAGTYDVSLTAANAGGNNAMVKERYVTVNSIPTPTPTPDPTCDLTGPDVTFGIDNYTCDGTWYVATCGQNALLNWALTGESTKYKDILATWKWRRNINCPNTGNSYAFDNPGGKDVYLVKIVNHDIDRIVNFDHEIAAELPAGADPLNFDVWRFFNYGELNIQKGVGTPQYPNGGQIPSGGIQCYTTVAIKKVARVYGCGLADYQPVNTFWIDSNNNVVSSQLSTCTQDRTLLKSANSQKLTSLSAASSLNIYNGLSVELKTILNSVKYSHQFATSRLDIDSVNQSMTIYTYDINDEQMMNNLNGTTVANYTIQMVHDTEFETTKEDVITQLAKFKEQPNYQISHISMNTDAFGDTPGYYAEVWVYGLTPENLGLDNTMIDEWTIHVYPAS